MKKFWNWIKDEEKGERVLRLEGPIDSDGFWGDEVTPHDFRDELEAGEGDVTVWINSEGGNVFAAAEIYTMLKDYKGKVTVKIASVAASAASVVAMAGDEVLMSPTAMLFLHDPSTIAMGNARDMEKAIDTLNAVKDSIINAYRAKTGLSRARLSKIMEDESWIHAEDAVKLGFADAILFEGKAGDKAEPKPEEDEPDEPDDPEKPDESEQETEEDPEEEKVKNAADNAADNAVIFSTKAMGRVIMNRLTALSVTDQAKAEDAGDTAKSEVEKAAEAETVEDVQKVQECEETPEPGETPQVDTASDPPADTDSPDADDTEPEMPIIGMDGRTKDGAMPYDLLKKQLDFLR